MAFLAGISWAGWAAIAGAAVTAVSAVQQGQAAKKAGDFNAEIARQNAAISQQEAEFNARQQQRETYQRIGAIRAAQGHSGGAGDQGSVLDIIGDTAEQSELERQNIVYGGSLKSRGYTNSAELDVAQGNNAVTGGYLKAGASLLSGASSAYYYGNLKRA